MSDNTFTSKTEELAPLIYSKIAAVMKEIGPISKDKINKEQHYQFRGIDALMNAINPILSKHGVFPTTHLITDVADAEVISRSGSRGYREVRRFTFRFFAEDGSYVDTMADGESIDYGDKGSNKANSVAYREAMFKMFVVPFENEDIEDADHDLKAPQRTEKPKPSEAPRGGISVSDKQKIGAYLIELGHSKQEIKDLAPDLVHKHTQLELVPEAVDEIIGRLQALIEENKQK